MFSDGEKVMHEKQRGGGCSGVETAGPNRILLCFYFTPNFQLNY